MAEYDSSRFVEDYGSGEGTRKVYIRDTGARCEHGHREFFPCHESTGLLVVAIGIDQQELDVFIVFELIV